jgi:hypothetical protein
MKKSIYILMAIVALISCKKDDSANPKTNYFNYNDKDYELNKAIVWHYGNFFSMQLYSPELEVTAGIPGIPAKQIGKGNSIALSFFTPRAESEISEGDYQYKYTSDTVMIFTAGQVQIDIDTSGHYTELGLAQAGVVTINHDETGMKISFELFLHTGDIVNGNYSGDIWIWDNEEEEWW